jgi:hypothetical protein
VFLRPYGGVRNHCPEAPASPAEGRRAAGCAVCFPSGVMRKRDPELNDREEGNIFSMVPVLNNPVGVLRNSRAMGIASEREFELRALRLCFSSRLSSARLQNNREN